MSDEKIPSGTENNSSEDIFEYYRNLNANEAESASDVSDDNGADTADTDNTADGADVSDDTPKYEVISDPDRFGDPDEAFDTETKTPLLSRSMRLSLMYLTGVVLLAAAALFIVYASGNSGLKPKELVESTYQELLAESDEYKEACERYDGIKEEIDDVTKERDEKQAVYDAMQGYAEKASDINAQIETMRTDLEKLEAEISDKTKALSELEASISAKASSIVSLSSGIYKVGEHIVAGKYLAEGSGSILVSNSKGSSKVNKVIGSDGLELTLDDGDNIRIESRVKFTPVN